MISKKDFRKINDWLWEIPKSFRPDMRVPARIYISEKMLEGVEEDAIRQVVNVATLPGIIKYSLAMPDIHSGYGFCLKGDTKVLTNFGFYKEIKNFRKDWEKQNLKVVDFASQKIIESPILKFLKLKVDRIFKLTTKTGKEIYATKDHPFFAKNGMTPLEKLASGDKLAIFPFEGVPFQEPVKKVIISEKDIKKTLLKLGRKPGQVGFDQNLQVLKKRKVFIFLVLVLFSLARSRILSTVFFMMQ